MVKVPLPAALALALALASTAASAQDAMRAPPPANSQKLSALITKVEARTGFRYVDEIEWSGAYYSITFFTVDKAKVEIHLDPLTGEPK